MPKRSPTIEAMEPRRLMSAAALLVPAYFYPTPGGDWTRMTAAAAGGTPVTAILNPDSGPGRRADPVYTEAVNELRDAGGQVVGYVHTQNPNGTLRPLAAVEAQGVKYKKFYPLDGIFVDEMKTDARHVNYYHKLYAFIKKKAPAYEVIGNPGTQTEEAYLTQPAADVIVDFEDDQSAFDGEIPAPWVSQHPASQFGNIVGDAATANIMNADLAQAQAQNAAYIFVTDQDINNDNTAYTRLPVYWDAETAAVRAEDGK